MNKRIFIGAALTSSIVLGSSLMCYAATKLSLGLDTHSSLVDEKPKFQLDSRFLNNLIKDNVQGNISEAQNAQISANISKWNYEQTIARIQNDFARRAEQERSRAMAAAASATDVHFTSTIEENKAGTLAINISNNAGREDNSNETGKDRTLTDNNSQEDPHEYTNDLGQITFDASLRQSDYKDSDITGFMLNYKDETFSKNEIAELEQFCMDLKNNGASQQEVRDGLSTKLDEMGKTGAMQYYEGACYVDTNGNLSSGKQGNFANVDLIGVKVDDQQSALGTPVSTRQIPYTPPVQSYTPPIPSTPSTPSTPPTGGSTEGVGGRQTGGSTEGVGGR